MDPPEGGRSPAATGAPPSGVDLYSFEPRKAEVWLSTSLRNCLTV